MDGEDALMTVFRFRDKWRAQVLVAGRCVASKSGFTRRSDAKEWHDETLREVRIGGVTERSTATMEELVLQFKKWHLPHVAASTRTRYLVDIDQRILPAFGDVRLEAITPNAIERFKAGMTDLEPKSVNNCLHTLRLILNRGVKWRMVRKSPYEVESLKVPKKPYEWWSDRDDIARFLSAAQASRYYAVYLTALETGMRYAELVGLPPRSIDFVNGQIHVHRQWDERNHEYQPPKHRLERWVPFDPKGHLAEVLRATVAEGRNAEAVFTTKTGALPTKGGLADKYFKAAQRRAGVPTICFHALRHTFASWYMIQHDRVWDLMALLGHSNVKTTMRYAHHSQTQRRQPLNLAAAAHNPHTVESRGDLTMREPLEKKWRDGRDLNPTAPENVTIMKRYTVA